VAASRAKIRFSQPFRVLAAARGLIKAGISQREGRMKDKGRNDSRDENLV